MAADLIAGLGNFFLTPQRFPISGVETYIFLPALVALAVSIFTSMGGISGAFLLLPYQVSVLNFTSPAVSPTNLVFNIVAIPSGVYRYLREGRMNWPVTCVIVLGTLPGLFFGALIRIRWLFYPAYFKLFVGCVLLYIGGRLLYEQTPWGKRKKARILEFESRVQQRLRDVLQESRHTAGGSLPAAARVRTTSWSLKRVSYEFLGETFSFSAPAQFALALAVGLISGTYGIGGGAIIAPFLAAVFQLPVYTIAGAALMATFITSVAGVGIYVFLAPFFPQQSVAPDWVLGALFGLGGFLGIYLGARLQRFFPGTVIRVGLGLIITTLALRYIIGFFI